MTDVRNPEKWHEEDLGYFFLLTDTDVWDVLST